MPLTCTCVLFAGHWGQASHISERTPEVWIPSGDSSWVWSTRPSVGGVASCQAYGDRVATLTEKHLVVLILMWIISNNEIVLR